MDDTIARQMREDWNRRVGHDYRFWMSDGYRDDSHMWATGARDFGLVSENIEKGENFTALELGCGVGRMLRSASSQFGRVIGLDVSSKAIDKAKELLAEYKNLELLTGSGTDLQPIPDSSVDFAWSFAAITSMPTPVIASYLRDMRRVIKPEGTVRLQVYLGAQIPVDRQDTLHLRCFTHENFEAAIEKAGFKLAEKHELILPFQVSFKELGIEAFIVSLIPDVQAVSSVDEISEALLPGGEGTTTSELLPTELEAWMTVNHAQQLASEGDVEKAKQAILYVDTHLKTNNIDTKDILEKILGVPLRNTQNSEEQRVSIPDSTVNEIAVISDEILEKNVAVLKEYFPDTYEQVKSVLSTNKSSVEVRDTRQGPVIWKGKSCLDHGDKPVAAAESWITRSLLEQRCESAKGFVIFGFGSAYHLETLLSRSEKPVQCIEPDIDVFCAALRSRDLTGVLSKLKGLSLGSTISTIESDSAQLRSTVTDSEILVRPQSMVLNGALVQKVRSIFFGHRGLSLLKPRFAVLGPVEGGTLPIGQYTYSSLLRAGQRSRGIDMSGFSSGYGLIDGFVTNGTRRNHLQGNYVEMMSSVLLETFAEKPIDVLICMAQAPITPRALMELRKRGVITVLWFVEDYLRFTYWKQMAQYYDFVFTIQKGECIDLIKAAGAGEVHYIPTACDPNFHIPLNLSKEDREKWGSPISFVGAGYHNRQQMFASLANLPFKIWGSEWPMCKPFDRMVQQESRRIAPEEYIKIFNATEINLNLHSSTERDGVDPTGDFLNPRTFELASCGAFQLVDERTLLSESFEIGKEIITFRNLSDLKEKIDYYQRHPDERNAIAQAARARVIKDHTYDQRIKQMLSIIYASKYEQLKSRADSSPWTMMLQRAKPHPELLKRCDDAYTRGEEPSLDGLISDIVTGNGDLSETEQKLLFLFHVRKQIIRMTREEAGEKS